MTWVRQRLKNPRFVSDIELDAWYVINEMQAQEVFVLGYVRSTQMVFYRCRHDGHQRFCIEEKLIVKHQIGALLQMLPDEDLPRLNQMYFFDKDRGKYTYDNYYDPLLPIEKLNERLAEQLALDGFVVLPCNEEKQDDKTASKISYYLLDEADLLKNYALRFALQNKASCCVVVMEPSCNREAFKNNYRHSYILPDELESVPIQLYNGESNLGRYCGENHEMLCVPLDSQTLDAKFWNDITWRELVPNENQDALVYDIPVKCLTLETYVDGFQNIYVTACDIQGKMKNVILKTNEKTM
jgi:hypothetical protein